MPRASSQSELLTIIHSFINGRAAVRLPVLLLDVRRAVFLYMNGLHPFRIGIQHLNRDDILP